MPRPKKEGAPEPKRRSRNGCWPCKSRKVKCGEEKPQCLNCHRSGEKCDYSIRLNWEGRSRKTDEHFAGTWSITDGTHQSVSPAAFATARSPGQWNKATPSGPSSPATGTLSAYGNTSTPSNPSSPTPAMLNNFAGRDHPSPPALKSPPFLHPHNQHFQPRRKYPSPSISSLDSPGYNGNDTLRRSNSDHSPYLSAPMLPPQDSISLNRQLSEQGLGDFDDRTKRRKLSPARDVYSPPISYNGSMTSPYLTEARPSFTSNPMLPGPLTPSSEDGTLRQYVKQSPSMQSASLEQPRRLSVKSLLSNPDDEYTSTDYGFRSEGNLIVSDVQSPMNYGLDQGLPDLDLPRNDDAHALVMVSPSLEHKHLLGLENEFDSPSYCEFGFGLTAKSPGFEKGGYYANPVPVKIPTSLTPLPSLLTENPMNLLYFHHFLNHTARILVPHDCEDNPFRKILPQLAIGNINLLNLLLAYSASHRARLLSHREPNNRIAVWVKNVFPALRHALSSQEEQISDSTLATAIMLASLEIISPNVFEVSIPWQEHLKIARQMIIGRGGLKALRHRQDNVSYFLSRWFAYLDVVGSLGGTNYAHSDTNVSALYDDDNTASPSETPGQDYEIDCLLGFTSHCVTILAKVADLARRCDAQRIAPDGQPRPEWQPSPSIVAEAERLQAALLASRAHTPKGCIHQNHSTAEDAHRPASFSTVASTTTGIATGNSSSPPLHSSDLHIDSPYLTYYPTSTNPLNAQTHASNTSHLTDADELTATNHAFHAAGAIHLARRVLAKPTHDPSVQASVRDIVRALDSVRPGGTAEACLVFPMFTAGCEALDMETRRKVLDRVRLVEGVGMAQVHKARTLMERVWATGRPWEALVAGEFFG